MNAEQKEKIEGEVLKEFAGLKTYNLEDLAFTWEEFGKAIDLTIEKTSEEKDRERNFEKVSSNDKILDKIIELFCVVDDRKYPEGTGVWGMDTELFSTDSDGKTGREKAREALRKIIT